MTQDSLDIDLMLSKGGRNHLKRRRLLIKGRDAALM